MGPGAGRADATMGTLVGCVGCFVGAAETDGESRRANAGRPESAETVNRRRAEDASFIPQSLLEVENLLAQKCRFLPLNLSPMDPSHQMVPRSCATHSAFA